MKQVVYSMCLNLHNCKIDVNIEFIEICGPCYSYWATGYSPPQMQLVMLKTQHVQLVNAAVKTKSLGTVVLIWHFPGIDKEDVFPCGKLLDSPHYISNYKHFTHWHLLESNTKQIARFLLCGHFMLGILYALCVPGMMASLEVKTSNLVLPF